MPRRSATPVVHPEPGPSVRHRYLATQLRAVRMRAHLSTADVAEPLGRQPSKVTLLEASHTPIRLRDVATYLACAQAHPRLWHELVGLTRDLDSREWTVTDLGQRQRVRAALNQTARRVVVVGNTAVPAPLRTPRYARAHLVALGREDELGAELSEQRVLLGDDGPEILVYLAESALHRGFGDPQVLRDQVAHLAELAARPRLTLRVVPWQVGRDAAWGHEVTWYELPRGDRVLAEDYLDRSRYTDRVDDVRIAVEVQHRLSEVALSPDASAALLAELLTR